MTDRRERIQRFAEWFRDALEQRALDQSEFVALSEIKSGLVSRYVNGQTLPRPVNAIKIADALGVPRDFVLALTGDRPLEETPPIDLSDPLVSFAAANQHRLTAEQKLRLVELAKTMVTPEG